MSENQEDNFLAILPYISLSYESHNNYLLDKIDEDCLLVLPQQETFTLNF